MPMPRNSPKFGSQTEEDKNINNLDKIRVRRWLYRSE